MLQGNANGNSENENAETEDNNSSDALQEQNVEVRSGTLRDLVPFVQFKNVKTPMEEC